MKGKDPLRIGPGGMGHLQHARRRGAVPDLGIAFIRQHDEIMPLGQRQQIGQISARGDGPLRICGRAQVDQRHPVQQCCVQRRVIGQEPCRRCRRHIDRLGTGGQRPNGVDLVEGVRHQNDRHRPVLAFRAQRKGRIEQPLARAIQPHDPVRCHVHAVAAAKPGGIRGQQLGRAIIRGVNAEPVQIGGKNFGHETGHRMLRLANGHGYGIASGGVRIKKRPQPGKCVIWQVRKPLWKRHDCLVAGVISPRSRPR